MSGEKEVNESLSTRVSVAIALLLLLLLALYLVWAKRRCARIVNRETGARSFYLHGTDGFWLVLRTALIARGATEFSPGKSSQLRADDMLDQLSFIWMLSAKGFPFDLHRQLNHLVFVNHIRGQGCLVDKAALADHLQKNGLSHLHPRTQVAEVSRNNQLRLLGTKSLPLCLPGTVIVKPSNLSNGDGIQILSAESADVLAAKLCGLTTAVVCHSKGGKASKTLRHPSKFVVQQYIAKPLLLHGKKFDVRAYVLIVAPSVAYFHRGYARLCSSGYSDPTSDDAHCDLGVGGSRLASHVTNYTMQRQHGSQGGDDGCRWSHEQLGEWLTLHTCLDAAALDQAMYKATRQALCSAGSMLRRGWAPGQFSLLGIDFLVDASGHVWLLEFSFGPGLPVPSLSKAHGAMSEVPHWMGELHTELLNSTLAVLASARTRWEQSGELASSSTAGDGSHHYCDGATAATTGQGRFVRIM
jgi:hypothetical protein